jgi:hypothetical protein
MEFIRKKDLERWCRVPYGRLSRLAGAAPPEEAPLQFGSVMKNVYYGPVDRDLAVPEENNIDIHKGIAVNPCSTRR